MVSSTIKGVSKKNTFVFLSSQIYQDVVDHIVYDNNNTHNRKMKVSVRFDYYLLDLV